MVGSEDIVNHTAKEKAFSPTGIKPAEKIRFRETRTSVVALLTDKDEPCVRTSAGVDEEIRSA